MKVMIKSVGDPSVGILPHEVFIDDLQIDKDNDDDIEYVRKRLQSCFEDIWGEEATVMFEYEWEDDGIDWDSADEMEPPEYNENLLRELDNDQHSPGFDEETE